MDIAVITGYFEQYGLLAVFVIVFLEYLNLPGFPAGVIMPVAGIMAATGHKGFVMTIAVSTAAGVLGSVMLYYLGRCGGPAFDRFVRKHFPKQQGKITGCLEWLKDKGCIGVFLAKLIPAVRTLISIPAGMIKMNPIKYIVWSSFGVLIWNSLFIGAGYFMGDSVFGLLKGVAL